MDNMQTANSLILSGSHLPEAFTGLTKAAITERVQDIVSDLMETGDTKQIIATAEAIAAMKLMEEKLRKDTRFTDLVAGAAHSNGGSITTASGAVIEAGETGVQYNYSNDAEWRDLTAQIEALTEKRKDREERMKSVKQGKIYVDGDTGEVTEGAIRVSKSSYIIKLAK